MQRPETVEELQRLVDFVLKRIGDKGKVKVTLNGRLKLYNGWAHIQRYVLTGRRHIEIAKKFFFKRNFYNCEEDYLRSLVDLIIHEISHFKYSKTRKLRKQYLKLGFVKVKTARKKSHTKAFYRLCYKLQDKFWKNLNLESVEL